MSITTHVLDVALGRPARDIPVRLEHHRAGTGWATLAERITDADGRVKDLLPGGAFEAGVYRITFLTAHYFQATGTRCFYPEVPVLFEVHDPAQHYHVPLLLAPWGYSTYRGS